MFLPMHTKSARVLFAGLLVCQVFLACGAAPNASAQAAPFARVDLTAYLHGETPNVVKMLDNRTLITIREVKNGSSIDFWDIKGGRIAHSIHSPLPLFPESAAVTRDGKTLAVMEDLAVNPDGHIYRVLLFDLPARTLRRTLSYHGLFEVRGIVPAPNAPDQIIVSVTPTQPESVYRSKFLFVDTRSGRTVRQSKYQQSVPPNPPPDALDSSTTVFSPSGHRIAIVNPVGESSPGVIDVLNTQGTLLANYKSVAIGDDTKASPAVISRVFFLSETKLFCDGCVYDMRTKTFKPFLRPKRHLTCVARLPGRRDAFFLSSTGLELWNILTRRMLKRWPAIRQADTIYFSPGNRVMGVLHGSTLNFWRLDPVMLKG
jgi:hypothetical protein